jgi:hypothetical protein
VLGKIIILGYRNGQEIVLESREIILPPEYEARIRLSEKLEQLMSLFQIKQPEMEIKGESPLFDS